MVGYGTYQLSPEDAKRGVLAALEAGYRHIDTAEFYFNEEAVGAAIEETSVPREDIFLTTKLMPGRAELNIEEKDKEGTIAAFKSSLSKLKTDYVDLYLIHAPMSKKENRIEQWKALIEMKKQKLIKHIGVSNFSVRHLEELKEAGLEQPEVNQVELHPIDQKPELIAYMEKHGIVPIAYSSLAPLATWRSEADQGGDSSLDLRVKHAPTINDMAQRYSKSTGQLLLRWALQRGFAILPKSSKEKRIHENFDLFDFAIADEDMATLNAMNANKSFAWGNINPLGFE